MDSSMTMAKSKSVPNFSVFPTFFFNLNLHPVTSESNAKETNFEKVERLSFGTTKENSTKFNGHFIDDYDPYAHRQIEHPIT